MLRLSLALALALAPGLVGACGGAVTADLELARPLQLTLVADPKGALQRVVKAVRADPDAGLEVGDVEVPATARVSSHREFFATGPARHVLEDYIRVHPELAPPAGYRFGYQRLRDAEGRVYWRMHVLEDGGLRLRRLARAELVDGADDGRPQLRLRLAAEDARALAELTEGRVGERLAVVQDGEVLTAPVLAGSIDGGVLDIDLRAAEGRSEAESALRQLLGR